MKGVRRATGIAEDAVVHDACISGASWRTFENVDGLLGRLGRGALPEVADAVEAASWDQITPDDPAKTYSCGQRIGVDSFCRRCGLVYCRAHYAVESSGASGYGKQVSARCPKGHTHGVYDDTGGC